MLRPMLADADPFVRVAVVEALAQTGPAGRGAMIELMRLQKEDAMTEVRAAASEAVEAIRSAPSYGGWTTILVALSVLAAGGVGVWFWLQRTGPLVPPLPRSSVSSY